MLKKLKLIILVGMIAFGLLKSNFLYAGEIDLLLEKLVEKGILTAAEAQQIKVETQEQIKKEIAQGKYSSLPAWVQNMKLRGDLRVRYQYDREKHRAGVVRPTDRHRGRVRLRVGLESKVNEKLLVGAGLATGAGGTTADASRSTNVSFQDSSSKKDISLDYAFAQYSALSWLTLIAGKFRNPLWEPGDLIWDTDINPEGGALRLSHKISSQSELFMNAGVFILDEISAKGSDPMLFAVQPGITHKFNDNISLRAAFSYYDFSGVRDKRLDGTTDTNSGRGTGSNRVLIYDYNNIIPAVELSFKEPFKNLNIPFINIPYFAVFAEYVKNVVSEVPDDKTGFMVGFKLGAEKVERWGDWQLRYNYAKYGHDAFLDILPDSDRYGGRTGIKAHEVMLDWGLGKNTWLGFDYYYSEYIKGNFGYTRSRPYHLIQIDWNLRF